MRGVAQEVGDHDIEVRGFNSSPRSTATPDSETAGARDHRQRALDLYTPNLPVPPT